MKRHRVGTRTTYDLTKCTVLSDPCVTLPSLKVKRKKNKKTHLFLPPNLLILHLYTLKETGWIILPSFTIFTVGAGACFPPGPPTSLGLGIWAVLSFLSTCWVIMYSITTSPMEAKLSSMITWNWESTRVKVGRSSQPQVSQWHMTFTAPFLQNFEVTFTDIACSWNLKNQHCRDKETCSKKQYENMLILKF